MKKCYIALLGLSLFLLTGCGTYYTAYIDSLSDFTLFEPHTGNYYLMPASKDIPENDLFFQYIANQLAPAFYTQGWSIEKDPHKATYLAKISYYSKEPQTKQVLSTTEKLIAVPKGNTTELVKTAEQTMNTSITYEGCVRVEGFLLEGKYEKPVWRTEACSTSTEDDFRTMLTNAAQALPGSLGTQTAGRVKVGVSVDENGLVTVDQYN